MIRGVGVGKTSILLRQSGQGFSTQISPTIGAAFCRSEILLDDGQKVTLQIWDTAGQERFRAMAPMYYRHANVALVVVDVSSAMTLQDADSWVKELHSNLSDRVVLCVLGNKCDLKEQRQVQPCDCQAFAARIGALYFEVSARENTGFAQLQKQPLDDG